MKKIKKITVSKIESKSKVVVLKQNETQTNIVGGLGNKVWQDDWLAPV